mmetsp:Transcript_60945/g.149228  ORF Transcript_60945/g.149228 Transcript_60945/m.149228 type:complete len:511 (-) Transcript_60945:1188-2720(-)
MIVSTNSLSRRSTMEERAMAMSPKASTDQTDQDTVDKPLTSSSSSSLGICQDVSRYEKIGGRVGEGTYGVVYKARDRHNGGTSSHTSRNTAITGSTNEQSHQHQHYYQQQQQQNHLSSSYHRKVVALKRCLPHHESSDGFPITTLREIQSLRICCTHPNIVTLLDIAVNRNINTTTHINSSNSIKKKKRRIDERGEEGDDEVDGVMNDTSASTSSNGLGDVFLVFEYCDQDLAQILDEHHYQYSRRQHSHINRNIKSSPSSSSPFSQSQVKTLIYQLLSAIQFCHNRYLIHRDIKPSNLLYDNKTGQIKLCDFGLSRSCYDGGGHGGYHSQIVLTPNVVSLWYRAPELLLTHKRAVMGGSYSFPIDLWSVGCVFGELLSGYPLLDGKSDVEQISKMISCLGMPPSRIYDISDVSETKKKSASSDRGQTIDSMNLWDRFDYLTNDGLTLLTRLLDYDPKERYTASQALTSTKYFDQPPYQTNPRDMPKFHKKNQPQQHRQQPRSSNMKKRK